MKNGYTTKELLIVIILLGVFTIVMIGGTSNAYKDSSDKYYEQIVKIAEKEAVLYGETLSNLAEEGNLVITLDDLVEAGYYVGDDKDGNVIDPRNSKHTLNGLKIKLTYESDGNIKAKVIEDE